MIAHAHWPHQMLYLTAAFLKSHTRTLLYFYKPVCAAISCFKIYNHKPNISPLLTPEQRAHLENPIHVIHLFVLHTHRSMWVRTPWRTVKRGLVGLSSALQTQIENISVVRKAWQLPVWIERILWAWQRIAQIPSIIVILGSLTSRLPIHPACSPVGHEADAEDREAERHMQGKGAGDRPVSPYLQDFTEAICHAIIGIVVQRQN